MTLKIDEDDNENQIKEQRPPGEIMTTGQF